MPHAGFELHVVQPYPDRPPQLHVKHRNHHGVLQDVASVNLDAGDLRRLADAIDDFAGHARTGKVVEKMIATTQAATMERERRLLNDLEANRGLARVYGVEL